MVASELQAAKTVPYTRKVFLYTYIGAKLRTRACMALNSMCSLSRMTMGSWDQKNIDSLLLSTFVGLTLYL